MFKLIPDFRRVVTQAHSFWLAIGGAVGMVLFEIYFAQTGLDVSPVVRWIIIFLFFLLIAVTRLLEQAGGVLRNAAKTAVIVIVTVIVSFIAASSMGWANCAPTKEGLQKQTIPIATPLIAKWEGFRSCAYIPVKGDVPTIGYGSTRGVKMGMCITKAEAVTLFTREVKEYMQEFNKIMPRGAWEHLTPHSNAAFTDLSFNVGWTVAARSTAARRMAAGNKKGACAAITWFNKAGGRVLNGLVNRRTAAYKVCMTGMA